MVKRFRVIDKTTNNNITATTSQIDTHTYFINFQWKQTDKRKKLDKKLGDVEEKMRAKINFEIESEFFLKENLIIYYIPSQITSRNDIGHCMVELYVYSTFPQSLHRRLLDAKKNHIIELIDIGQKFAFVINGIMKEIEVELGLL
jgi:hypothetical protein